MQESLSQDDHTAHSVFACSCRVLNLWFYFERVAYLFWAGITSCFRADRKSDCWLGGSAGLLLGDGQLLVSCSSVFILAAHLCTGASAALFVLQFIAEPPNLQH